MGAIWATTVVCTLDVAELRGCETSGAVELIGRPFRALVSVNGNLRSSRPAKLSIDSILTSLPANASEVGAFNAAGAAAVMSSMEV